MMLRRLSGVSGGGRRGALREGCRREGSEGEVVLS